MNSATSFYVNTVRTAAPSSLHYMLLTGTLSSVAQANSANFTLSGFDSNYVSANGGQSVTLAPGVWRANANVTFGQPVTGTGTSWCALYFNVSGTNARANPPMMQTNAEFNGWYANNGSKLYGVSDLYLPSGGTLTLALQNSVGATITNATLKVSLKQISSY